MYQVLVLCFLSNSDCAAFYKLIAQQDQVNINVISINCAVHRASKEAHVLVVALKNDNSVIYDIWQLNHTKTQPNTSGHLTFLGKKAPTILVEPRLTDTPQKRTLAIRRTVRIIIYTSIDVYTLKPLSCKHLTIKDSTAWPVTVRNANKEPTILLAYTRNCANTTRCKVRCCAQQFTLYSTRCSAHVVL